MTLIWSLKNKQHWKANCSLMSDQFSSKICTVGNTNCVELQVALCRDLRKTFWQLCPSMLWKSKYLFMRNLTSQKSLFFSKRSVLLLDKERKLCGHGLKRCVTSSREVSKKVCLIVWFGGRRVCLCASVCVCGGVLSRKNDILKPCSVVNNKKKHIWMNEAWGSCLQAGRASAVNRCLLIDPQLLRVGG